MKKHIKLFIITLISLIFIWCISQNLSFASSDFVLNKINFDVNLNEDGSMKVAEYWDIEVYSMTNTLFKTFEIDKEKYKEITNVKVSQIENETEKPFSEKNVEVNHVDKNCYYDLINKNGKFEIAWGINEKRGKKTYKIEYTVVDAIKNYNDCSELYWQFIGRDFEMDIDKVTGTINIPKGAENKEEIRAWAHGPLNGNIQIDSANKVSFEVEYLDMGNFVEIRLAMPTKLFIKNQNIVNTNRFDTIIGEETVWANEANMLRERELERRAQEEKIFKTIKYVITVVLAILSIYFVTRILKYSEILKENPKIRPTQKLDYFRDIPDENSTPAQASFLYYFKKKTFNQNISKILSSTILDLSLKGYIEFENTQNKRGKHEILVKFKNSNKELTQDETIVYELLKKVNETSFTMKDLEKYAKKHYDTFLNKLDKIENIVKKEHENNKNYEEKIYKKSIEWNSKMIGYITLLIIVAFLGAGFEVNYGIVTIFAVIITICAIYAKIISKRFTGLTQKGVDEQEKWTGLKKYMEEFSLIDERTVPELALWEKYLVYATAFGIADKVLKQLKIVYPQIATDDFSDGAFLGLMYYSGMQNSLIHSLEHSVNRAYQGSVSAKASYDYSNSSSGGGFGGGFSGGGGFGGGGGGRRRTLKTKKK